MNQALRCIAFVSPLGGTGQTTVVANMASLWRASGTPCLAVDLCAQNSLGLHLGHTHLPPDGWANRVEQGQWWAQAALENSAQVRFLPFGCGPTPAPPADPVAHPTLQRALQHDPHWLSTQLQACAWDDNSLVLLDAPLWPQALAAQALRCADLVVVCLDTTPRAPLLQTQVQRLLEQARPGAGLALLATRFNPRRDSQRQALQTLQQQWPHLLAPHVLHDDESVPAALAAAHCVSAHAPQAQSAHDLNGIARWLLARCPTGPQGQAA